MYNNMYKKIFKLIKSYNNIVIARHVGVDPDAMASQIALKNSIKKTFPEKHVYAIGNGTVRFNFIGHLDRGMNFDKMDKILLIVLDTPDKRRVDMEELTHYEASIKIDHHPFIEKFCDEEFIDKNKSSASEMVYDLINNTKLVMDTKIAETIYAGMVADTNRFLFNNSSAATFKVVSEMLDLYHIDITKVYENLYIRPMSDIRLFGYMASNMKITSNGVGYIKVTDDILKEYETDAATCGNLINDFNNVEDFIVWVTATEDIKNNYIRVSMRSRGPIINKVAEKYNGGGHAMASGAKVKSFEEVDELIKSLDNLCLKYKESSDKNENN